MSQSGKVQGRQVRSVALAFIGALIGAGGYRLLKVAFRDWAGLSETAAMNVAAATLGTVLLLVVVAATLFTRSSQRRKQ
jgi:hypothetical protein